MEEKVKVGQGLGSNKTTESEKDSINEVIKNSKRLGKISIDLDKIEADLLSKREKRILINQYFKNKFIKEFLLLVLASFIVTITFQMFINSTGKTGNFSFGLGTICKFLAILTFKDDVPKQSQYYFVYYIIINIPLLIFGFIKLGAKFSLSTLIYMLLQIIIDRIMSVIPFINPAEFHLIINYVEAVYLSPWVASIYLFLFSSIAGLLLGYSYAILYRVGASTGGTDFGTFYFSIKKNKPIGKIARVVNLFILVVVIIANVGIMDFNDIPLQQKYSGLSLCSGDATLIDWLSSFSKKEVNPKNFPSVLREALENGYGNNGEYVPKAALFRIKTFFVFGPSLFASLCGVFIQSAVTDYFYPRYKIRTYIVTTSEDAKICDLLSERGYKNDLVVFDVERVSKGAETKNRKNIIFSMLVLNWKMIQNEMFLIDPELRIISLETAFVKGFFSLETEDETTKDTKKVRSTLLSDNDELTKIKKKATERAKANKERYERMLHKQSIRTSTKKNDKEKK